LTETGELPIFKQQARVGISQRGPEDQRLAMSPALVLTTVNAPYSKQLDALELAECLKNPVAAKAVPGHMSSFFGEVDPALQVFFANLHNISTPQLVAAATAFAKYSGEAYPLAA
jgi:hypothetical protein